MLLQIWVLQTVWRPRGRWVGAKIHVSASAIIVKSIDQIDEGLDGALMGVWSGESIKSLFAHADHGVRVEAELNLGHVGGAGDA